MDPMRESLLFIQALLAHVDRLRDLMGSDWSGFQARLEEVSTELARTETDDKALLWVDEIFEAGVNSRAADLVRSLYDQAAEKVGSIDSSTRSVQFTDPTLNQSRVVVIRPEEQAGTKGAAPAVNKDDLVAASRALLRAVNGLALDFTAAEPPPTPAGERRINAWVGERPAGSPEPLELGQPYTLNFMVGRPVQASLISGPEAVVPAADVPAAGLLTDWVVLSRTVELAPVTADTTVTTDAIEGVTMWSARFALRIPQDSDSATIPLKITPRQIEAAGLEILIYAGRELYRQFSVRLSVAAQATGQPPESNAVEVHHDLLHTPTAQANLRPPHQWTTPPGTTTIFVGKQVTFLKGDEGAKFCHEPVPWQDQTAVVGGPIINVRAKADQFRARWDSYLNDIDPDDLTRRLAQWTPASDWTALPDLGDDTHQSAWDEVKTSSELRDLAYDGHILYETFFPPDSPHRKWLESLTPGHRLDIVWQPSSSSNYIPHVPWGLMYLPDLPAPGQPIDPLGFAGLRFRLGYTAHEVQAGSKALGRPEAAYRGHLLYWGDQPQDPTAVEARWQRQRWAAWQNQVFLPTTPGPDSKTELLRYLDRPDPTPMTVLYLFCQCSVGEGNDPVLRFGSTNQPADVIRRTELATQTIADRPLVFANACTTSASDPYLANELEEGFFRRGCRAYLGTETKVPIQFASRLATIFFNFFYRQVDYLAQEVPPRPLAAGEALAQTRLFLWTRYRNIGGLFYTYVNQFELFMADEADIVALRD